MDSVECRRALDYAYSRLKVRHSPFSSCYVSSDNNTAVFHQFSLVLQENDPTGALEAVVAVIKGTMGEASVAPLLEQAASRSR